jgi:hypothetical protein
MKKIILLLIFISMFPACNRETTNEPADDGIPPNPPAGIVIYYANDGEIGIEWINNSEPGIEGYNIYRAVNDSSKMVLLDFTSSRYYFDSNLYYDSVYYYSLKAIDIFGRESEYSDYVSATPVNRYKPYPPTRLTVNALNWYDSLSINLTWLPPPDTDIEGYYIYRNIEDEFELNNLDPIAFTNQHSFSDSNNLELLINYFYRLVAVDKGGLKSSATTTVTDIIFDRPGLIFPVNDSEVSAPLMFKIRSISTPADYKIIIQRNEQFDVVYQKKFSISEIKSNISVSIDWYSYEPYRKYYWRVITNSPGKDEPNSFSDLGAFLIIP